MTRARPSWTLLEWLAWLETLSPREIDLGLERVSLVLERLGLPRPARVVHVGGSNGKGSCAAMLESLYLAEGGTVGCYTSPHVLRYNERIRVDGRAVDDATIVEAFRAVEANRGDVPLTYFEYGTLAALVVFAHAEVPRLVLEIGLGGRLDAVNAVEPCGAIITNVTLEHCDWLGDDVEAIAVEKAGIMRRGIPVVFGARTVPDAIVSEAGRVGADLRLPGRDFHVEESTDRWTWQGRKTALHGLRFPSLHGRFQLQNAAAVLALIEALEPEFPLEIARVDEAFGRLLIPGRFQRVSAGHEWLLDVAHNPDAARVLGESLADIRSANRIVAIMGVLADKNIAGIVGPLAPHVSQWIAATAEHPRARASSELAREIAQLTGKPCLVKDDVASAMTWLDADAAPGDLLLVTGSFYAVGPALAWLDERQRGVAVG